MEKYIAIVYQDGDKKIEYRWNYAHTVRVFVVYPDGTELEVHVFTFGDWEKSYESFENFEKAVHREHARLISIVESE